MANLETSDRDIINTVIDPVCGAEVYPVGISAYSHLLWPRLLVLFLRMPHSI